MCTVSKIYDFKMPILVGRYIPHIFKYKLSYEEKSIYSTYEILFLYDTNQKGVKRRHLFFLAPKTHCHKCSPAV